MTDAIERSRIRMEVPYFQTPNAIFDMKLPLDIYSKITYIYLCRCGNQGAEAFPSYNTIADRCSMSRRKAIDSVKKLIECNLLEKRTRKKSNDDNYSNIYYVNDPSAYCAPPSESDAPTGEQDAPNKEPPYKEPLYKENIEGSKPEIREGTPNGATTSIPYYAYLQIDIARYKTDYKQEIVEAIVYYYEQYKLTFNKEHFRYTKEQLKDIYTKLDTLFSIGIHSEEMNNIYPIDLEEFKALTDQHFKTNYSGNMSYTLLSFLNDNVLINRYWECLY